MDCQRSLSLDKFHNYAEKSCEGNDPAATIAQSDDLLVCSQELLRRRTNREDVTARVTLTIRSRACIIHRLQGGRTAGCSTISIPFVRDKRELSELTVRASSGGGGFTSTVRGFTITDPPPPFDTRRYAARRCKQRSCQFDLPNALSLRYPRDSADLAAR